jgi:hypothetical protein
MLLYLVVRIPTLLVCRKSAVNLWADIAETMPKYLRPQLEQIFQLALKMIGNEELGKKNQ